MRSLRPKTHFVPLGDITETPHISDAPEPRPVIYILHPSTGTKQADPTPIQARDLFALGRNMAKRRISRRKLFNAKNSTTQPQIPGGPACQAAVLKSPGWVTDGSQGRSFLSEKPSPKGEPCVQLAAESKPVMLADPHESSRHPAKSCPAGRTCCEAINKPQDTEESLRFSDAEPARSPLRSSA